MSENKNIGNRLAEFFRYIRNELSGKERNFFERGIQRDPFEEEALDGFSTITEQEAEEDITNLNERLRKRTLRNSRSLIYRIAGIVVLFIAVSAVVVVSVIKKPENQLAINTPAPEKLEITRNQPIIVSDSKDNAISARAREEKKSFTESDQKATKGASKINDRVKETNEISNDIALTESNDFASKEEISKKLVVSAPMAALARKQPSSGYTISGKILSSEDNLPIPGANIQIKGTSNGAITNPDGNFSITIPDSSGKTLIASFIGMESQEIKAKPDSHVQISLNSSGAPLSEVVVVGYSTKQSDREEEDISEYIHPQPVSGKSEFDEYVKNNLHRPEVADGGKKMVVVLSFLVRTNGEIDNFRIIKSPGKAYSDEAIRVINSGPGWNPAMDNGKPVEEDVRLRIVFR
jgi:hypothetical protein